MRQRNSYPKAGVRMLMTTAHPFPHPFLYRPDAIALEGVIAGRSPGSSCVNRAVSSVISEAAI